MPPFVIAKRDGPPPGPAQSEAVAKRDERPASPGQSEADARLSALSERLKVLDLVLGSADASRPPLVTSRSGSGRWVQSSFARPGVVNRTVELDVMGRNPLLEDLQKSDPTTYAMAERNNAGAPPTLFAGGDLPIFTASGIEPQQLMRLPWVARHPAAAEPDRGKVAAIFEACAGGDEAAWNQAQMIGQGHRGNHEYAARMKAWADAFPADQLAREAAARNVGVVYG